MKVILKKVIKVTIDSADCDESPDKINEHIAFYKSEGFEIESSSAEIHEIELRNQVKELA